ncbi:MAG: transcriptional repressor MprA, partial [Solirubrobacterales bacterium]|nr:transcriptional repressor MprA [Solirubrobacterales bacterium]
MASDERTANLLGAHALTLTDSVGAALDDEAGVTGTDAAALITLHNYAAGESLDILRGALGLSQPGMVRVVDRLERRGLLRRRRAERDARAIALELTPSGRRVAQAA